MVMVGKARISMHAVLTLEPAIAPNLPSSSLFFLLSPEKLYFSLCQANFCFPFYCFLSARSLLSSNWLCSPSSDLFSTNSPQLPKLSRMSLILKKQTKNFFNPPPGLEPFLFFIPPISGISVPKFLKE